MKRWTGPPFTRVLAGGQLRRTHHVEPVSLPVCDQHTGNACNQRLDNTYEVPGKAQVRAVLDRGDSLKSPDEVEHFARWWIKTLLLLQHPAAGTADDVPDWPIEPWDVPQKIYDDLLVGRIVDDLSLWVAVHDEQHGTAQLGDLVTVELWRTPDPSGRGWLTPATTAPGYSAAVGTGLFFMLVWHPRIDFTHPFEAAGLATRLWPRPPSQFDPRTLPALSFGGLRQFRKAVVLGGGACDLDQGWRMEANAVAAGGFAQPMLVSPDSRVDPSKMSQTVEAP